MRHQRLDLNLLTALRTLLTEKSVTRAAELLHVSQPAMSGTLARLREYFDDSLIVPVGRRMELTPLGASLVDKVSEVLVIIDATLGTKPEFDPATTHRHFVIVASDYAVETLLLDVLRDVHEQAPRLTLTIRQAGASALSELETGDIDLLLTPAWPPAPTLSHCALFDDSYSAVVDRANAEVGEALTLAQYLSLGHVAFENNRGLPLFETWVGKQHAGARRVEVRAASFQMLPRLVVGTRRVATLHARQAARACIELPVRRVRLDFELPPFTEYLLWHQARDHDPGSLWLRERMLDRARALRADKPSGSAA